jgi:hypothetical protein
MGGKDMNHRKITQARDKDLPNSLAAMKRAAQMAREEAIRTDTAIIVMRDNKVVRVTADELRQEDVRSEPPVVDEGSSTQVNK